MPRWAWLATIAIGCGHPSTPAAPVRASSVPVAVDAAVPLPLHEDLPRLAKRAVQLYADWKLAFEQAGTDCALATEKLNALADANADLIAANQQVYRDGHERVKALRAELAKHEAELEASAKAIVQSPTMSACAHDPAFARALDRLGGEG